MSTLCVGSCDASFRRVRQVFEQLHGSGQELGSAVSVYVGGKQVVDLCGGFRDKARTLPWSPTTLVNLFSVTKAFASVCALRLVDEGRVDLDRPLSRLWPELAAAGKERLSLRHVLAHRAGLPAVDAPLAPEDFYDWGAMTRALERQAPWWEPGSRHGYHPITFGWLVGEVVRRATGSTLGGYLRDVVCGPLGLDLFVGLPESEDARCAELQNARRSSDEQTLVSRLLADPQSMAAKAFTNPITPVLPGAQVSRAWRGAEIPSANGHGNADAVARLFAALARGGALGSVRVLSGEAVELAREEHSRGPDPILFVDTRFGLGFMLPQPHHPFAREGSFGHTGAGGALGFADPDAQIGFGYAMNRCGASPLGDPRAQALADAVYESL